MSLTDEIYRDLMDGLKNGVEYDKVRLKWEGSKGPFYNALQRVFADVAAADHLVVFHGPAGNPFAGFRYSSADAFLRLPTLPLVFH